MIGYQLHSRKKGSIAWTIHTRVGSNGECLDTWQEFKDAHWAYMDAKSCRQGFELRLVRAELMLIGEQIGTP